MNLKSVLVSHVNHSVSNLLLLKRLKVYCPAQKLACKHCREPQGETAQTLQTFSWTKAFSLTQRLLQTQREHQETEVVLGFKAI